MGWRGYIDDRRKTVFFWSQKAACTSLFAVLADNMVTPPKQKKYFHTESLHYWRCLPIIRDKGYRTLILARHPATRAVSAYFNKFCLYNGKPLKTRDDLEPFSQALHDRWVARTGADPETNAMTFEDFLDTVEDLFANRPESGRPVNGHWETQMPQALADDPDFSYDWVLHVERFDTEMAALARRLDLTFEPRSMNRTKVADTNAHEGYLGDVPAYRVADHAFTYANFLTDQTLDRIQCLYAVDYAPFGYPRDPEDTCFAPIDTGIAARLRNEVGRLYDKVR